MNVKLTRHQKGELGKVVAAIELGKTPVVLAGAAGTGKTTCMNLLASGNEHFNFDRPLFLAPTNRAALVLRQKLPEGSQVATIHTACMRLRKVTHEKDIHALQAMLRREDIPDAEALEKLDTSKELARQVEKACGLGYENFRQRLVHLLRQAERDNELIFEEREESEYNCTQVVVDEASMVTTAMWKAIDNSFPNVPVVFVGDIHQLPPILSDKEVEDGIQPVLAALKPTGRLDEVIRQAETSRVLEFATWMRKQRKPLKLSRFAGKIETDELEIVRRPASGVTKGLLRAFAKRVSTGGIVLCRRNDTRRAINRGIRPLLGWEDEHNKMIPVPRERLVVSSAPSQTALDEGTALDPITREQVPWDSPLLEAKKGTFVRVVSARVACDQRGYAWVQLVGRMEGFKEEVELAVGAGLFLRTHQQDEGREWGFTPRGWFQLDYGACMSVHKAQGSEFDAVAVYEQMAPWTENEKTGKWQRPCSVEHRQWCYTAATRAKKSLLWVAAPAGGGRKGG